MPRSIHSCVAGSAISSMPTATPSRLSTALFVVVCERSCADSFIVRGRADAFGITPDGQMPSSLILGCSRCPRPFDWRANPDVETTDWRARRGKTAHRVRREGTAIAVSYPYPLANCRPTARAMVDPEMKVSSIQVGPSRTARSEPRKSCAQGCTRDHVNNGAEVPNVSLCMTTWTVSDPERGGRDVRRKGQCERVNACLESRVSAY